MQRYSDKSKLVLINFKKSITLLNYIPIYLIMLFVTPQFTLAGTNFSGTVVGDFQVSENGSASYAIPVTVPPGIKGMQPNLAVTYSSQGGNSLLGIGWNLSGLSAIIRCPQTLEQDNNIRGIDFSSEDRFCLDGQRLVETVPGSGEYFTEMESYSKITAIGGSAGNPDWFEVRTKDGKIKEYGHSIDSYVNAIDAITNEVRPVALMWAINKTSDHSTNYIEFTYIEDTINGDHYISRIDYTGNFNANTAPFSSVQFFYERSTVNNTIRYLSGTKSSSLNRLINIKTFEGSQNLIQNYRLKYDVVNSPFPSSTHLIGLDECDNSAIPKCKLSPTFIWNKISGNGKVISILNGLGEQININYKLLTYSTVHTRNLFDPLCVDGEVICTNFPMYVVSSYNKSNGQGGLYSHSYKYSGVKRNILGRGSLGFASVTITDNQTNVVSQTNYRQDFPFVGVTASNITQQQNGTPISKTVNSWFDLYGSDPTRTRFNVKTNSSDSYSYELNSSQITHVTTTNTYGGELGEVTTLLINSNDGYTKTTTNTYYPADQFSWIISQLNTSSVTSLTPTSNGTRKSQFTYVAGSGLVKTETVEPGNIELEITKTYGHDVYGNKISTTVSGNAAAKNKFVTRSATVSYDYSQLITATTPQVTITSTNALGHSSSKVIDSRYGKITRVTGVNGISTNWVYDSLGRKIRENRADGSYSIIDYQICEVGTVCIDAIQDFLQSPLAVKSTIVDGVSSNSATVYFDKLGREILKTTKGFSGKTIRKKTEYDIFGRITKVSLPYFNEVPTHDPNTDPSVYWTSYQFDLLGRQIFESKADASTTTIAYNGFTTSTTNNLWQTISKTKNSQGQLVTSTDPYNNSNSYKYDAFGKVVSVTDAMGNVSSMAYDIRGRKISMNDADMGFWTYEYNALGELVLQTDAKSQTTTMSYDILGRLQTRDEPEGTSTWTYDSAANAKGKLVSVSGPNSYTRTHQYDALGRPSSITVQYGTKNYATTNTYIANSSRMNNTTFPGGQVITYGYDAFGFMNQIVDGTTNTGYWKPEFTDAFGNVTQEVIGGKIITTKTYQATSGVISKIRSGLTASSSSIQNLSYSFDSLGNLKSRQDNNNSLSEVFTYDDLNRLLSAQMNALPQKTFSYDAVGNITSKSDVGTYTYDDGAGVYTTATGGPHAVSKVDSNVYTYDLNGNQLTGAGRTITYTSFNKPATISRDAVSNSIYYDSDHNRVEKISTNAGNTTTTFYLGKSYQQVTNSSGLVEDKYFVSAGGATVLITKRSTNSNDVRYILKDHIGSSDVITDELGSIIPGEILSFDAWGKRRQGDWTDASLTAPIVSLTSQGFTGHEMDDGIGLINMNARMYDAEIGRFLSPDTFVQFPDSTQGMNRYTYVNNNPLSFTDPTGNFLNKEFKEIGKFLDKNAKSIARAFTFGVTGASILYTKPVKNLFLREQWARQLAGAAANFYGGPIGSSAFQAYLSDISGFSDADILASAAKSLAMSYIMSGGEMNWTPVSVTSPEIGFSKFAYNGYVTSKKQEIVGGIIERNTNLSKDEFNGILFTISSLAHYSDRENPSRLDLDGLDGFDINGEGVSNGLFFSLDIVDSILAFQGLPTGNTFLLASKYKKGMTVRSHSLSSMEANNLIAAGVLPSNMVKLDGMVLGTVGLATNLNSNTSDLVGGLGLNNLLFSPGAKPNSGVGHARVVGYEWTK